MCVCPPPYPLGVRALPEGRGAALKEAAAMLFPGLGMGANKFGQPPTECFRPERGIEIDRRRRKLREAVAIKFGQPTLAPAIGSPMSAIDRMRTPPRDMSAE